MWDIKEDWTDSVQASLIPFSGSKCLWVYPLRLHRTNPTTATIANTTTIMMIQV